MFSRFCVKIAIWWRQNWQESMCLSLSYTLISRSLAPIEILNGKYLLTHSSLLVLAALISCFKRHKYSSISEARFDLPHLSKKHRCCEQMVVDNLLLLKSIEYGSLLDDPSILDVI